MSTGTVKWFNETKGFGFIQNDEGGQDVFVHISAVQEAGWKTLEDGEKINFEITKDEQRNKEHATNLTKAA